MRRGGNALNFHVSPIPRGHQQLGRLARHTANAYERRTQALASDPCRWVSMSAKSDRHTRVGGPCSGGVVGAANRRARAALTESPPLRSRTAAANAPGRSGNGLTVIIARYWITRVQEIFHPFR